MTRRKERTQIKYPFSAILLVLYLIVAFWYFKLTITGLVLLGIGIAMLLIVIFEQFKK